MKIGSNKVKIITVSLLRFIVVSFSLVALYGSGIDNPNTNNVAFVVITILDFAFAASPLRHLNDVLELCPNKIIYEEMDRNCYRLSASCGNPFYRNIIVLK